MAGEITLNQLLQAPVISRVVSELNTPISAFQQYFKMTPGSSGATERVTGDNVSWDIFNRTRTMAKIRPRGSGPPRSAEKPIGANSATIVRMHDSIHLEQEKIFRTRPLGQNFDGQALDVMGQNYIERQLQFLTQRFRNGREYMLSRLFRGGFGVKLTSMDNLDFCELDDTAALFTVDYQIPAAHKTFLEMGTGANIIDGSWDNPATDIITQLYKIREAGIRETGFDITEFWIDSPTFTNLQKNTGLATVAGSANTVFQSISGADMKADDADSAKGFTVKMKALPMFTFHVYDGVLNTPGYSDSSTAFSDQISTTNTGKLVPTGKLIGHPSATSAWLGSAEGSEIVAESYVDPGKHVHGFHTWKNRTILPPGWDLIAVDNWLPLLYIPRATVYASVVF